MGLKQYLVRRIVDSVIVVWLILLLNFFLFYRTLPEISELSIIDQLNSYIRFVFIDGFRTTEAAQDLIPGIVNNLPFTIFLWGSAIITAILLSIFLGAVAAYKFKGKINIFLTVIFISLFIVPSWWLSKVFQKYLHPPFPLTHWFSISVWADTSPWINLPGFVQDFLWHMVLPVMALTFSIIGVYFLVVRNSMMSLARENFVTLLKAKGLSFRKIVFKHIFRNAIIPIAAIASLTPLIIINASVEVERTFSMTGVGYFLYRSLITASGWQRVIPIPSVQAIFLILAFIMVALQFIFDVAQHSFDPRLRIDGGGFNLASRTRRLKLKTVWKRFVKRKSGVIGLTIIAFLILIAILAPILPIDDPEELATFLEENPATPPSFSHFLGTDEFGRDVLSRLIWGTRVSIAEFFGALAISLFIGCIVGLISGYYGRKWFSYILDRITDVFISIPLIVFVLFFPLEPGWPKWILAVGTATWGITAKIAKAQAMTLKEKAYIEAARAAGAGNRYIILHYIFPEAFTVVASSIIYTAALIIGLQSTLDYFGFRRNLWSTVDPTRTPSIITWGSLMSYGSSAFMVQNTWWVVVPPAICMVLLGLSMVFVADAISFALNPHFDDYILGISRYTEKGLGSRARKGFGRLYQKLKPHKRLVIAVMSIVILVVLLIIIPTAHVRARNEARSDLEQIAFCWGTLIDGKSWHWDLADLSSSLRIVVNLSSSELVKVDIKTLEGKVYSELGIVHEHVVNASGPYVNINIENPAHSGLGSATVAGDIRIYHDYEAQVSYTEWLPWWMP